MAKQYFSVSIPVKNYIKQYLHSLYGSPIIFSQNNHYTLLLFICLEKKYKDGHSDAWINNACRHYDTEVKVNFPVWWLSKKKYNGFDLDKDKIILLNQVFETRFNEELFAWCFSGKAANIKIKHSLNSFCENHGIEIEKDISYENLKKIEFRYRKALEENLRKMSPKSTIRN